MTILTGYDYFAPEKSVCFHSYAKGENMASRNKVPHFWGEFIEVSWPSFVYYEFSHPISSQ